MWHRALGCGTELRFGSLCNLGLPWFVKETAFFFAKAQNLRIRLVPNSWDSYAGFLWHRALLLRLETHVLPIALCKSTRIRLVPNSWIVCFELWHRALLSRLETHVLPIALCKSTRIRLVPVFCGTELCFCRLCNFDLPNKQRFSLQKHKSCKKLRFLRYSACAEFLDNLL